MTQIIFIVPIVEHRLYEYHELQRNLLHEVSQTEDLMNQKYSVDIVLYSNFDIFCKDYDHPNAMTYCLEPPYSEMNHLQN